MMDEIDRLDESEKSAILNRLKIFVKEKELSKVSPVDETDASVTNDVTGTLTVR
jgi:hypothetical protein